MSISTDHSVGSHEISEVINSFINHPNEEVALARDYNFPMPSWSICGRLDKITGILSSIWLDRYFTRSPSPLENPEDYSYNNPTHCYCLADALMAKNIFKQSYIQSLRTFEQFEEALRDSEPGIFRLTCFSLIFGKMLDYFPAHALTIIKFSENNVSKYRVVQCFQGAYSLSDFILNYENDFIFENFSELNDRFLTYFKKIYYYTAQWGQEEEDAYKKITKVRLNLRENPNNSILMKIDLSQPRWAIERTTNSGSPTRSTLYHSISTALVVALLASMIFLSL